MVGAWVQGDKKGGNQGLKVLVSWFLLDYMGHGSQGLFTQVRLKDPSQDESSQNHFSGAAATSLHTQVLFKLEVADMTFLLISGLRGTNIQTRVERDMFSLFDGQCLFEALDGIKVAPLDPNGPFIMPIMDKVKELGTVLMGNVESGSVHKVDNLLVMPNKVRVVAIYCDEARFRSSGTGENLRVRVSRIKIEDIRSGFVLSSIDITPIPLVQKFIAQLQILELEDLVRHGYNVNGNYSSGFSEPLEEDMAICLDEDDPMKQSHKEEELRNVNAGDHDHRDSEFPRKSFEDLSTLFIVANFPNIFMKNNTIEWKVFETRIIVG
ncbi:eukaryotic peptide chain release factor GTP-binding subunit ERF3A-like protein [Tanacetum coccineum]|uniref:Eukaryotic peptide chain release factor GTP-binding subunit ERF3A-like protein n=1 Tax=Tanacetum coccineum TaxID=301880 RepID=A0ABQ5A3C6_9ASTR